MRSTIILEQRMKNVIDFDESTDGTCIPQNTSLSPEINQFVKFIVDRAGKSAVSIVNTCAMDDSPYWRTMFEMGMADAISEDPDLEKEFLGRMCEKPGLPHSHKIVEAYFQGMPADRKEKLFSVNGLKKRGHYFSVCFYGASFKTTCGMHLLQVLKVIMAHGVSMQTLIDRNCSEVERAALLGHTEFLKTITSTGAKIPDDVIKAILQRGQSDGRDIEILSMLIDECNVGIDQLIASKFMEEARSPVKAFLQARRVRMGRIPESVNVDAEEEEMAETT
jgi:hypothetical protein